MEQAFLDEGMKSPTLGPHYFAAREAAKRFVEGIDPDVFEPIIKDAADRLYAKLLDDVQNYLTSNVEDNAQGDIWRGVDDSVQALLSGERWALERYALTNRYGGEKIRAAIAKHIPKELQILRLAELEAENKQLRDDLERERRRY